MGKKTGVFNVQDIAKAAAVEALKLQRKEDQERFRKNRYHNTELLLKNYLDLVEHFESALDTASELQDIVETFDFADIDLNDIVIQAIRKSKIRTKVMIRRIETSLDILKAKMIAKGQPEKFEVIQKLYLDPAKQNAPWAERAVIVADELSCDKATVYRWRNEMIKELSLFLFGIDGLQLEV